MAAMASLKTLPLAFGMFLVGACSTEAQRRADEDSQLPRKVAAEVARICSLPQPARDAEIKKTRDESGFVVRCPAEAPSTP